MQKSPLSINRPISKPYGDKPEEDIKEEVENFDDITLFDMTKDESSITLQSAPNMSSLDLDDDFDKL